MKIKTLVKLTKALSNLLVNCQKVERSYSYTKKDAHRVKTPEKPINYSLSYSFSIDHLSAIKTFLGKLMVKLSINFIHLTFWPYQAKFLGLHQGNWLVLRAKIETIIQQWFKVW